MAKSITTEEFVKKAKAVHGDKYDYSKVEYVNTHTKVCIICPEHGEFWQRANSHIQGVGCPICGGSSKSSVLDFIRKSQQKHGNKYVYDLNKINYINNHTKVCITCPSHGDFWVTPSHHLKGTGCPVCSKEKFTKTYSIGDLRFRERARMIHGDKYIYNKVHYINNNTKVCIICPEHGEFWQTPCSHLNGAGCPKCVGRGLLDTISFCEKAKKIHGDKYIYNNVKYVNNSTKVCITCPKHGDFWQTPYYHLKGQGCKKCANDKKSIDKRSNFNQFKQKADQIHQGKYIYNDTNYVDCYSKICITCPTHGKFWQTPDNHLQGKGCPKCGKQISIGEEVISKYIQNECHIDTIVRDRTLLGKKLECDIVIPSHNLAIEFNGLRWHSEQYNTDKNYHLHKTEIAESKGYHLIHIFEDEWLEHKDLVLSKIRHFLGNDTDKPVIGARKCTIETVSKSLVEPFLNTYHLQGFVGSTIYYGAFHGNEMVGVMTFKQEKTDIWNLNRFATDTHYRLPGLADKLFKRFIKDKNPREVKTFLDRRWSHGNSNVYEKMRFSLTETLPPDYRYVVKNQRLHKFGFRKQILAKKYNLPLSMTEREMTEKLGFYRIWDCGLYKYVWKR